MKHLKSYKIFESERFSERDITVIDYSEIENEFGISSYDIGLILTEFVEEYDLLYRCRLDQHFGPRFGEKEIVIYFYNPSGDSVRNWVERKIGHGHIWDWEMLSEIDSRLSDYGLTIKRDDIYQIFLNDYQLQLIIKRTTGIF
jgi:hypothetical protein